MYNLEEVPGLTKQYDENTNSYYVPEGRFVGTNKKYGECSEWNIQYGLNEHDVNLNCFIWWYGFKEANIIGEKMTAFKVVDVEVADICSPFVSAKDVYKRKEPESSWAKANYIVILQTKDKKAYRMYVDVAKDKRLSIAIYEGGADYIWPSYEYVKMNSKPAWCKFAVDCAKSVQNYIIKQVA
jgi:hypothetical protein